MTWSAQREPRTVRLIRNEIPNVLRSGLILFASISDRQQAERLIPSAEWDRSFS